jgi:hypothetical protein
LGFMSSPFWPAFGYGYPDDGSGYGLAWGYPGYGSAPDPFDTSGGTGSVRLAIEQRDADVYVDGYYAGVVDDFDGHFQHLNLTPGAHRVEIREPGYEPLIVDLMIQAHHKISYRGGLLPSTP